MKIDLAATFAAIALAAAPVPNTTAQDSGTFTVLQNGNAIATERFTRTADRLDTRLEVTGQGTIQAVATLRADATIGRLEVRVYGPGDTDGDPVQSSAAEFGDGSVQFEQPIGTPAGDPADVAAGAVPYINPSPSYMEQVVRRARAIGGDSVSVPVWIPGFPPGQAPPAATVAFEGDRATLMLGSVEVRIRTDAAGRLLAATVPSQNLAIGRE